MSSWSTICVPVPESFGGLAVTREGEYYRPRDGHLGLAGGVPAALLLERRAALEQALRRIDALRVRELGEAGGARSSSRGLARGCRGGARHGRRAGGRASQSEERVRAATPPNGAVTRSRELLSRAERRGEALRLERDEAIAEAEALEQRALEALTLTQTLAAAQAEAESRAEARQVVQ